MAEPSDDAFTDLARRLELGLVQPGYARGRWRRRGVSLEASGRLRVALSSAELPLQPAEALRPLLPTAQAPELGVRSEAPGRLLAVLERSELTTVLYGLLARGRALEVSDTELCLQLEGTGDLPALKQVLDHAVEVAASLERALTERPPKALRNKPESDPDRCDPARLKRYRERVALLRGRIRTPFWVSASALFALVVAGAVRSGGLAAIAIMVGMVSLPLMFDGLEDAGCPACEAYLTVLWRHRRCPRCGVRLE